MTDPTPIPFLNPSIGSGSNQPPPAPLHKNPSLVDDETVDNDHNLLKKAHQTISEHLKTIAEHLHLIKQHETTIEELKVENEKLKSAQIPPKAEPNLKPITTAPETLVRTGISSIPASALNPNPTTAKAEALKPQPESIPASNPVTFQLKTPQVPQTQIQIPMTIEEAKLANTVAPNTEGTPYTEQSK